MSGKRIQFNREQLDKLKCDWNKYYMELNNQLNAKREIDNNIEGILQGRTKSEYRMMADETDRRYKKLLDALKAMINRIESTNTASTELDKNIGEGLNV